MAASTRSTRPSSCVLAARAPRGRGGSRAGPPGGTLRIRGLYHVDVDRRAPRRRRPHARKAVCYGTKAIDRSPCGNRLLRSPMARLVAREPCLAVGDRFVHESIIGTTFDCRVEEARAGGGHDAIRPSVAGWARIMGHNTIFVDDRDPLAHGFRCRLAPASMRCALPSPWWLIDAQIVFSPLAVPDERRSWRGSARKPSFLLPEGKVARRSRDGWARAGRRVRRAETVQGRTARWSPMSAARYRASRRAPIRPAASRPVHLPLQGRRKNKRAAMAAFTPRFT